MTGPSLKRRAFDSIAEILIRLLDLRGGGRLLCAILDKIQPAITVARNGRHFTFSTPNSLCLWRATTLFTKEPETLEWIDGFDDGDVFYDVGANVGAYTIYAGVVHKGIRIMAFEPSFFNYWLLNWNIHLNGLQDRASALSIALAARDELDHLYMPSVESGAALVTFGAGAGGGAAFRQGALGFSIDTFIERFSPPFPNHIKIDVDGTEDAIVRGADKTLRDARLKSVSIEIDDSLPTHAQTAASLSSRGLQLRYKRRSPMFDRSIYQNVHNCVFVRDTP